MELLKFFIKDEVPAVGLSNFRNKRNPYYQTPQPVLKFSRRAAFKPNYRDNFFLK